MTDPMIEAVNRLKTTQTQRNAILMKEPCRLGKNYDAWEKQQITAFNADLKAFDSMTRTVPTTAAGAVEAIDAYLNHSFAIDLESEAKTFLKSLRAYLRRVR